MGFIHWLSLNIQVITKLEQTLCTGKRLLDAFFDQRLYDKLQGQWFSSC